MNKLNLPPFYVGQKVVYVEGKSMPKDSIHTVLDIWQEPCGCWIVDVKSSRLHGKVINAENTFCLVCQKHFKTINTKSGIYATSFRPIQEAKPPLMTFTQIKETEKEEILTLN